MHKYSGNIFDHLLNIIVDKFDKFDKFIYFTTRRS